MKNRISLIVALIMITIAVAFFIYALSNPQASFLWSNTVTYTLYAAYGLIVVVLLVIGLRKK